MIKVEMSSMVLLRIRPISSNAHSSAGNVRLFREGMNECRRKSNGEGEITESSFVYV